MPGTGLAASAPHESVLPHSGGSRQVLDAPFQAWHSSWAQWQLLQVPQCQSHLSCSLLLGAGAGANAQSCQVWTDAEESLVRDGGNQSGRAESSKVTAAVPGRRPGTIYNSQVLYQVRTAIKRPNTLLRLPGAFKIKAQILTGPPRARQGLHLSPLSRVTHTGLFSSWDVQPAPPHPPAWALPIYSTVSFA